MSGKPEDITGLKVNRLTAVSFSHRNTQGQRLWLCRCDCGADTYSTVGALKRGHKKSCGCLKIELFKKNATKHGMSGTGEYSIWEHVIQRCTNPNNDRYSKYGGRGIKVCKRWMSFESFIFDMGPRPTQKHSIDRIDNNKGYSPSNCKWSTHTEQARNTGMFKNNTTGVKGVHARGSKWTARIAVHGKSIHLGTFATIEQAAKAREEAEVKYWGEMA